MEKPLLIALMLLAIFIMLVSVASLYAQSQISSGNACTCAFPIELLIPLLSSVGLLIGSFVYYFMTCQMRVREKRDLAPFLSLLDYSHRRIIELLLENGGTLAQSKLVRLTNMNKVKVSRSLAELEQRGIIKRQKSGITKTVKLNSSLSKLLQ